MFDEQLNSTIEPAIGTFDTETSPTSDRLKKIALITVMHPDFQRAVAAVDRCMKSFGRGIEPVCAAILGDSGCGKSHLGDRFERLYPRVSRTGETHIPVLRVRVPSNPTIKGCASAILAAIGDPLHSRGTETDMNKRIKMYFGDAGTQLVLLDESQHLVDAVSEKLHLSASNWIKMRIEETRTPFVVEGLRRLKKLFDGDEQLRDRFDGPYYLVPFRWFLPGDPPEVDSSGFRGYLRGIHRNMPFEDCLDFSQRETALRFFCASNGVPRRVGKLITKSAMIAEAEQTETIDLGKLEKAFQERCGFRVSKKQNPFSKEFDLDEAEAKLEKAARRGPKEAGEGVYEK